MRTIVETRRVIVCCGAGGVGKTSVSAALALAAARFGRRVLVITIDPSRRLADLMGIARRSEKPVRLPEDLQKATGIVAPGLLDTWVLDPQRIADAAVRALTKTPREAERLLENRVYRNVTKMIAGMQEYTAVEALHGFVKEDRYDLVVLDTPPSRNALQFLESPSRLRAFIDGRIFNLFVPRAGGRISRAASRMVDTVFDIGLGKETRQELQEFFQGFTMIFRQLSRNASDMRSFFRSSQVSFLAVTSPAETALREAFFFADQLTKQFNIPLGGFILNRSMAYRQQELPHPRSRVGTEESAVLRSALEKLASLADEEHRQRQEATALLAKLEKKAGAGARCLALPVIRQGVTDVGSLVSLADALVV